jgi:hypothetical protein
VKPKCDEVMAARGTEICDGADNDGDGEVDERTECPPIDIRAFVVRDQELGEARERLQRAVDRANEVLGPSRDDARLRFVLRDVVRVDAPEFKMLTEKSFAKIVSRDFAHPDADEFYVPVILVDQLLVYRAPARGAATVPDGRCGGHYRDPRTDPWWSAIVLSRSARRTTLAHELGHFFGLCHTHSADPRLVCPPSDPESALLECLRSNDGICDTPPDPGLRFCSASPDCTVACTDGATPDPRNIMSYYAWCRNSVTLAQHRMMRQALALRRGWHRCVTLDDCACSSSERPCPAGMSCGTRFNGKCDFERCTACVMERRKWPPIERPRSGG